MTIVLNHTIVPVADRAASAGFLVALLALPAPEPSGPFTAVRVNAELTLDFDDRHPSAPGHYAFLLDDGTFDGVLGRLRDSAIEHGSGPEHGWDRRINRLGGGRGVYARDPGGPVYEFVTTVP